MKISPQLTDEAVLRELGGRLASARIEHGLTQAALSEQAGVSKRTVERLESGEMAAFQYDRAFAASGIELSPVAMPLSERVHEATEDVTPFRHRPPFTRPRSPKEARQCPFGKRAPAAGTPVSRTVPVGSAPGEKVWKAAFTRR